MTHKSESDAFAHLPPEMALPADSIESDLARRVNALEMVLYRLLAALRQGDFGERAGSKALGIVPLDDRQDSALEQIRERLRDWQF